MKKPLRAPCRKPVLFDGGGLAAPLARVPWRVGFSCPTSTPNTTKRLLALGPTSSGYRPSFRRRAASRATPGVCPARGLAVPSLRSAFTFVVSTASWAPPDNGRPSATPSRRLPSASFINPKSNSRTLPPPLDRLLRSHSQEQIPFCPESLPVHKQRGGGQIGR